MSEKLPAISADALIRVLEQAGFVNTRKSGGSHWRFCHPDGRKTTIPVHAGKTIGKGLLRRILRDVGISVEALRSRL